MKVPPKLAPGTRQNSQAGGPGYVAQPSRLRVRVILLLGSVCLTAALAAWWYMGRNAPRQDGLTANDWIELTARKRRTGYSDQDIQAGSSALLKLGTNAFPALRSAFTCNNRFQAWLATCWAKLPGPVQRRVRRPLTGDDLRETARDLVQKWPREQRISLARIVTPQLLAMALDHRSFLVSGVLRDLHPPAELVMPSLRRLVGDPGARGDALFMLIDYGAAAAPAVPELIECLSDRDAGNYSFAIQTLSGIGPPAKAAVPALERALTGPAPDLVAEALWSIDRQTNTALRILTRFVDDRSGNAAWTLGRLGAAGRPAVPALLAGLESKDGNVRINSGRALWKIAPENLPRVLGAVIQPLTNGVRAGLNDWDTVGPACYAAAMLKELGDDATPARWVLEAGLHAKSTNIVQACRQALEVVGDGAIVPRKPTLTSWFGSTPQIDGVLAPDEWADATAFRGVRNWTAEFSPVSDDHDLSLRAWVKHDDEWLYFAFQVTDDILYGIDTERWLPKENAKAHELAREGFPWFGDEIEILLNAPNTWRGDEESEGNGASWQMVCNFTKSRLGGIGVGGLLEGEPRSAANAWGTYQSWIQSGAQKAAARKSADGKGYVIEWAIRFNPCVELAPEKFYSSALGEVVVGLNIALGDLDTPEKGERNFGKFHHEQWWAGSPHTRTQKNNFGTLRLMGRQPRPAD